MTDLPDVLYFGCESKWRIGHFLFLPGLTSAHRYEDELPESLRVPDGTFAPHKSGCRKSYCGCGSGPEGKATIQIIGGWTVVAFWDRSADGRGASNSVFMVRGEHTFEQVVSRTREAFPTVWARFPFGVVRA